jgi:hypothetical protein
VEWHQFLAVNSIVYFNNITHLIYLSGPYITPYLKGSVVYNNETSYITKYVPHSYGRNFGSMMSFNKVTVI